MKKGFILSFFSSSSSHLKGTILSHDLETRIISSSPDVAEAAVVAGDVVVVVAADVVVVVAATAANSASFTPFELFSFIEDGCS